MIRSGAQVVVVLAVLVASVAGSDRVPGLVPGCVTLEVNTSIEEGKIRILEDAAEAYNREGRRVDGRCVEVSVHATSSGRAMQALRDGWESRRPATPEPQAWLPTSSMWIELLRESGTMPGLPTPGGWQSLTQSVLVVAMPETMADALAEQGEQVTWERILELSETGWGPLGHPEWGEFSFGKDNPHLSTSGLAAQVATFHAAAQVTQGVAPAEVRREHLEDAEVRDFVQAVEAGVHTYADDIIDFLRNLARYDADNNALDYVSAVVLQEQLVYEYNTGAYSPNGSEPSEKLVAFYPAESTLRLDHPMVVLPSASDHQRALAHDFFAYLQGPETQEHLAEAGFRRRTGPLEPWTLDADVADAIGGQQEVDQASLVEPPGGDLVQAMLDSWNDVRKQANILLVLDTSASMDRPASGGSTRLQAMQAAVQAGVDRLLPTAHDVGLWTLPSDEARLPYVEHVPIERLGEVHDDIDRAIDGLTAGGPTPLYRTVADAHDHLARSDPNEINAVVVLTDGGNHDPGAPDNYSLEQLLDHIDASDREERGLPSVKVFTIGFSEEAETQALEDIARVTRAEFYDASDPATLDEIFLDVISNF